MSTSLVFQQLESRRIYADQKLNNTARDTRLALIFETRGVGEIKLPTPVMFDLSFVEMPIFSQGFVVADHTLQAGYMPMGNVAVWKWHQSSGGLYIGAYLMFKVTGRVGRIEWHAKFEGEALRAVAGDEGV